MDSFWAKQRKRFSGIVGLTIILAVLPRLAAAQVTTTTVQGTVYRADGSAATGTVLVSWPAFSTALNQAVAAGNTTAEIGQDGFLSVNLAPNQGAYPAGSYYTVVYHLNDGTVNKEYWVVPATATAAISSVRAQLAPATVAIQPVNKSYVDTSIAAITGNYLPLSGGTMSGTLVLQGDPAGANQAATKHYADALAATELPLSGGTLNGPLNTPNGVNKVSALESSMVKALANDITVCGEKEPGAYVTEFFQGDGTTVIFNLTEEPYFPPSSKTKPLIELFQEPTINTQIWQVGDSGSQFSLTANGFTCAGGSGIDGNTTLSLVSQLEMGGSLVLEAGGVQFGTITQGILNGVYDGAISIPNCFAGFQITQPNGITTISPLVNGTVAGATFIPIAGHIYMLRLRIYCNEIQRVLQSYNSIDDSGTHSYGGVYLNSGGSILLEVQDTTNGVAATPVILYSGSVNNLPGAMRFALINSADLQCSIASLEVSQQGPVWVISTPPGGGPVVRRLGATAQGADCKVERTGKLRFYATSIPQTGELVAISYRTSHRAVARLANQQSIAQESANGQLPGTAAWIGTVTSPAARSSMDCENAASALLDLATSRGAAWKGKYTAWNMEQQGDVWPGDVLAVSSTSTGLNTNLVVRKVQIELLCTSPGMTKYLVEFANDWADALAIRTSKAVPADVWLPQQPEATPPLANLASMSVSAVTGSAIQVSANVTPPTNGGFEVRRRDWTFGPGTSSDLVLRSPVANFTIPREGAIEQYYVRLYDGSTPPNYSRFSSAVFVNVAL